MLILFTIPGKSEVWSIVTNFLGGDVLHDLDQLRGAAAAHCARILRSGTRITFETIFSIPIIREPDMWLLGLLCLALVGPSSCLRCYTCSTTTTDRFTKVILLFV